MGGEGGGVRRRAVVEGDARPHRQCPDCEVLVGGEGLQQVGLGCTGRAFDRESVEDGPHHGVAGHGALGGRRVPALAGLGLEAVHQRPAVDRLGDGLRCGHRCWRWCRRLCGCGWRCRRVAGCGWRCCRLCGCGWRCRRVAGCGWRCRRVAGCGRWCRRVAGRGWRGGYSNRCGSRGSVLGGVPAARGGHEEDRHHHRQQASRSREASGSQQGGRHDPPIPVRLRRIRARQVVVPADRSAPDASEQPCYVPVVRARKEQSGRPHALSPPPGAGTAPRPAPCSTSSLRRIFPVGLRGISSMPWNRLRNLVTAELAPRPTAQILFAEAGGADHERGDLLAPARRRDSHHRHAVDGRVGGEDILHLGRMDVHPTGDDDVLEAPRDGDRASGRIRASLIAGGEPFTLAEGGSAPRSHRRAAGRAQTVRRSRRRWRSRRRGAGSPRRRAGGARRRGSRC